MTRIVAVISLALALVGTATANSAADAKAMPIDEFTRVLGERAIDLDTQEATLLVKLISEIEKSSPEIAGVGKKLAAGTKTLTFKEIMPLLTSEHAQAVCAKLAKHDDPVLRFVSNGVLAGSGDSDAAKSVYDLIHSEKPSPLEKRLLKTWSAGIGIHAETDDATKILDHLTTVMGKTAKFKPGDAAPDFEVMTASGRKLSLKQLQGKVIVLHFWATWCGPCVAGLDGLQKMLKTYSEDDVAIIFVSLDEKRETFDDSIKKHQLIFNNVMDEGGWGGTLARSFGVYYVPLNVIIDGTGKIVLWSASISGEDIDAALAKKTHK
jgi:peroxiredoxin